MSIAAARLRPTWAEELRLMRQGYHLIAGIDEVGRGPLAGPVMAAAVILDPGSDTPFLGQLRDSKALSPAQRERLAPLITAAATAVGLGAASPQEIDTLGIVPATRAAMARAVAALAIRPDHLLVDALPLPEPGIPFRAIIKGDALCRSIAAASIVAKVARDHLMQREDALYPGYGFAQHKGYPTPQHLERLAQLGPCPIHRQSFAPVGSLLAPAAPPLRPHAQSAGSAAETAAAAHLEAKGYQVVERNFSCRWGEIDLVTRQGETVVFVEVKARRSTRMGTPWDAVTQRKQQRLILSAQEYLQRRGLERLPWRIDVIAARLGPSGAVASLEHLENAVSGF